MVGGGREGLGKSASASASAYVVPSPGFKIKKAGEDPHSTVLRFCHVL